MSEIDQLFEQAAELTGDERARFLAHLADADRRAVEELLSADQSLQQHNSFLKSESLEVTLAGNHESTAVAGSTPNVRYFGEYELLHELARGGMGVVFKRDK